MTEATAACEEHKPRLLARWLGSTNHIFFVAVAETFARKRPAAANP